MNFPVNPEIGKFYLVPHIHCIYVANIWVDTLIPINTPLHDDKDYIKVNVRHYHIDWRFINRKLHERICHYDKIRDEQALIICEYNTSGDKNIGGDIIYKKVRCKRPYQNNKFEHAYPHLYNQWPVKLQSAYCGKELKKNANGQYVCPHKGAIIELTHLDEKGRAVCPAHLLKFDTETLKAV